VSTRRRASSLIMALVVVLALVASCSKDPAAEEPGAPTTTAPAAPPAGDPPDCGDPVASYAPDGPLPAPGQMPNGTTMARIQERGRLIVGVSGDNLLFGSVNPETGELEGFDVDMAKEVARAIFGENIDGRIQYVIMSFAQRIPALQDRTVDMVANVMTINCARWEVINFSSEYYQAGQTILVAADSGITGISELAGQKVCAPANSTSADQLALPENADIEAVIVPTSSDCMVAFQSGEVVALAGDDTVLAGYATQDPYAVLVDERYTEEPYGLGINQEDVDFTRFVNGVLEQIRTDGTWAAIYERWLGSPVPTPPQPVYGRELLP
jgi:polar amino acid transport system substrate-binding protein